MRLVNLCLLLVSLAACGLACEKNVQEVRRTPANRYNSEGYDAIRGNPSGYANQPSTGARGAPTGFGGSIGGIGGGTPATPTAQARAGTGGVVAPIGQARASVGGAAVAPG